MQSQPLPRAAPRFFYGWIITITCFFVTLVASGTLMAFGVFINPMADDLGWTHSALSLTYAISSIVSGLAILAIGSLIHRYSIRNMLFWGNLIHGIGLYMTSTITTVEGFYLWYGFVSSVGRSVFLLATTTLITRWFETRRGMAMGLTMAGNGLGPFLFSPLVTWIILRWDWQTAFVVLSLLMTAGIAVCCVFLRNSPHDMGLLPYGAEPAATPDPLPPPAASPAKDTGSLWGPVLRMEGFWTLAFINFFCCMCHSIPLVHVVPFAQASGLSPFASSWVLALMSLSSVAGRVAWGVFADRHGPQLTLMLTLFLQGTLVLWLVNTQDPVIFFLYALAWGFGYGGVNTQYGVVARELYGPRFFGPGFAGQMCFAMVGMAVGGFLGGYLYDISQSYTVAWLLSFGAGLISSLLAMDLIAQADRVRSPRAAAATSAPAAGG